MRAGQIDHAELAQHLPMLAEPDTRVVFDEDGGVIRARASIEALIGALRERLVFDEVLSVRPTPAGTVEVRAGGRTAEHGRVVVCAGRGTAALARGAGLPLPIRQAAHVRLTFAVRGDPPPRAACLLDSSRAFGEVGAYGDPLPGNAAYAVGLDDTPLHDDGSVIDAGGLAALAEQTTAYVERALPGLDPQPIDVRHCWVTELPWSPDAFAVWEVGALLFLAGHNLFKHAPGARSRARARRARRGAGAEPAPGGQARRGVVRAQPPLGARLVRRRGRPVILGSGLRLRGDRRRRGRGRGCGTGPRGVGGGDAGPACAEPAAVAGPIGPGCGLRSGAPGAFDSGGLAGDAIAVADPAEPPLSASSGNRSVASSASENSEVATLRTSSISRIRSAHTASVSESSWRSFRLASSVIATALDAASATHRSASTRARRVISAACSWATRRIALVSWPTRAISSSTEGAGGGGGAERWADSLAAI